MHRSVALAVSIPPPLTLRGLVPSATFAPSEMPSTSSVAPGEWTIPRPERAGLNHADDRLCLADMTSGREMDPSTDGPRIPRPRWRGPRRTRSKTPSRLVVYGAASAWAGRRSASMPTSSSSSRPADQARRRTRSTSSRAWMKRRLTIAGRHQRAQPAVPRRGQPQPAAHPLGPALRAQAARRELTHGRGRAATAWSQWTRRSSSPI